MKTTRPRKDSPPHRGRPAASCLGKRPVRTALALAAALVVASPPARADDDAAAKRAKMTNFFDAGAEAFKAGKYLAAAEAFEKAHALVPSPALLFSAAQAYRRQYLVEPSPDTLRRALFLFREYLRIDPKANRREDAMEALAVLVPLETRVPSQPAAGADPAAPPPVDAPPAPAPDPKRTARILITAGAEGAEVALDGGPYQPTPLLASVEPGPHRARVRAPGHDDEEVTVPAVANEQVPQHVYLRPKAGKLEVTGTGGARIAVDGKPLGTVPAKALPVEPGSRFVAITLNGHEPWSRRVDVGRDQTVPLDADLKWTQQRKIAWATISVGIAGLLSGAVLGGLAFDRQSRALALQDKLETGPLSTDEREIFNLAVQERNDYGQAAGITGVVSALVLATGVGLYAFDEPPTVTPEADPSGPKKPAPSTTLEIGLGSAKVRVLF
jgi:tetratricopeptide (TPR) repeat protein